MHECCFLLHFDTSLSLPQRSKSVPRRFICSVATELLAKEAQDSKMEAPKEIFLKDYKKPDYYFDTVWAFMFFPPFVCAHAWADA